MTRLYRIRQGVKPYGGRVLEVPPDQDHQEERVTGRVRISHQNYALGERTYRRRDVRLIFAASARG